MLKLSNKRTTKEHDEWLRRRGFYVHTTQKHGARGDKYDQRDVLKGKNKGSTFVLYSTSRIDVFISRLLR